MASPGPAAALIFTEAIEISEQALQAQETKTVGTVPFFPVEPGDFFFGHCCQKKKSSVPLIKKSGILCPELTSPATFYPLTHVNMTTAHKESLLFKQALKGIRKTMMPAKTGVQADAATFMQNLARQVVHAVYSHAMLARMVANRKKKASLQDLTNGVIACLGDNPVSRAMVDKMLQTVSVYNSTPNGITGAPVSAQARAGLHVPPGRAYKALCETGLDCQGLGAVFKVALAAIVECVMSECIRAGWPLCQERNAAYISLNDMQTANVRNGDEFVHFHVFMTATGTRILNGGFPRPVPTSERSATKKKGNGSRSRSKERKAQKTKKGYKKRKTTTVRG